MFLFPDRLNSYMMLEKDVSIPSLVDDAHGLKTYKESVNFWMDGNQNGIIEYKEEVLPTAAPADDNIDWEDFDWGFEN